MKSSDDPNISRSRFDSLPPREFVAAFRGGRSYTFPELQVWELVQPYAEASG
jgi:hypothetical protein